jgi:hypothetical protein
MFSELQLIPFIYIFDTLANDDFYGLARGLPLCHSAAWSIL